MSEGALHAPGRAPGLAARRSAAQGGAARFLLPLFLISLVIPTYFFLGTMRLSPYRLLLVVMFIPLLVQWLGGKAGRIRAPDILILLFCLWEALALARVAGIGRSYQFSGIFLVETFGGYLLARVLIRDFETFRFFVKCFALVVLILGPFAMYEAVSKHAILLDIFRPIMPTHTMVTGLEERWGMRRAQGPFEHPILYGVFCASAFALSVYVLGHGRKGPGRLVWPAGSAFATFASLSAGAWLAVVLQIGIMIWDHALRRMRRRWWLFLGLVIAAYVAVDILSNRTPVAVFISYMTFNAHNSFIRLAIFEHGMNNVWARPLFGMGPWGDWFRPYWLPPSVDNFWLLMAMRHGIPAFLFLAGAWAVVLSGLARMKSAIPAILAARKGLLIVLAGLAFSLSTVHLWNATYVFLCALLGSGMWMVEWRDPPGTGREADAPRPPVRRAVLGESRTPQGRRTVL